MILLVGVWNVRQQSSKKRKYAICVRALGGVFAINLGRANLIREQQSVECFGKRNLGKSAEFLLYFEITGRMLDKLTIWSLCENASLKIEI